MPPSVQNGNYVIQAEFKGADIYIGTSAETIGAGDLAVLPEYAFGALAALGACLVAFIAFKNRSALLRTKKNISN